jgi:hypothetical protein
MPAPETEITIPLTHQVVIRKIISGILPNAQNSSLFSAASVKALNDRAGAKITRNVQQDAETVRQHCILITRQSGLVRASGRGVYDKGSPIGWSLSWNDEVAGPDYSVALDPQSLFTIQNGSLSFTRIGDDDGPICWSHRTLVPEEGKKLVSRVRRLSVKDSIELKELLDRERMMGITSLPYDLTDDARFFRAVGHMTATVEDMGSWTVAKTGYGEVGRLICSWRFGESNFGFIDAPSSSNLADGAEVTLSRGNLNAMAWILDRFSDETLDGLEADGEANKCSARIHLFDESAMLNFYWTREANSTTSEYQEAALSRCRVIKTRIEHDNIPWAQKYPLSALAEGISIAIPLCQPILGKEDQAGMVVSIDPTLPAPSYVFRCRNTVVSVAFRMGNLAQTSSDLTHKLYMAPEQARSVARMLRVMLTDFSSRNIDLCFEPGLLMLRGAKGLIAGIILGIPVGAERLLVSETRINQEPLKTTPKCFVDVNEFLESGKLAFQLALLPAFNQNRKRTALTENCTVEVKDLRLSIEMGSENHVVGTSIDIPERLTFPVVDKRLLARVPSDILQSTISLFDKVMAHTRTAHGENLSEVKCYLHLATGGGEGLYLGLRQNDITVARVRVALVHEPGITGGEPLLYTRLSPLGKEPVKLYKLPETTVLTSLAQLHQTFALPVPEEHMAPGRQSMTGMEYQPTEGGSILRVTNTAIGLRWKEPTPILGKDHKVLPPGFFTAAALMKGKHPVTGFADMGTRMHLSTSNRKVYATWEKALPPNAVTLFPSAALELMLTQRLKEREIDPDTGLVNGLGTPGRIKARTSKEVLLDRLQSIENDGIYGRVAWIWDRAGRNHLLEEESLNTTAGMSTPMRSDVLEWNTPGERFFLCIGRRLLQGALNALTLAEETIGREIDPDIILQISSSGVQLVGENFTAIIMPMNLQGKEQEYLQRIKINVEH